MEREGNFARGCLWGLVISIPLWIALIWLVKSVIEQLYNWKSPISGLFSFALKLKGGEKNV